MDQPDPIRDVAVGCHPRQLMAGGPDAESQLAPLFAADSGEIGWRDIGLGIAEVIDPQDLADGRAGLGLYQRKHQRDHLVVCDLRPQIGDICLTGGENGCGRGKHVPPIKGRTFGRDAELRVLDRDDHVGAPDHGNCRGKQAVVRSYEISPFRCGCHCSASGADAGIDNTQRDTVR